MKRIDIDTVEARTGSGYPAPHDVPCKPRIRQRLGAAAGLTQFGVNLLRLPPGAWSSQRHWHTREDEFVFVISGQVVLVTNKGEEVLTAGDCAGFKANDPDGHHLQNRSDQDAVVLEVGSQNDLDGVFYPDIDMLVREGTDTYIKRDGTPY